MSGEDGVSWLFCPPKIAFDTFINRVQDAFQTS
jgi:hypothetical protein